MPTPASKPFEPFRLHFIFDTVEMACFDVLARDMNAATLLGEMIAAQSHLLGARHCKVRVSNP